MEYVGILASLLLASCGVPAIIDAHKKGRCTMPKLFLLTWCAGEILGLIYVIYLQDIPLILNYGPNTLATIYLLHMSRRL